MQMQLLVFGDIRINVYPRVGNHEITIVISCNFRDFRARITKIARFFLEKNRANRDFVIFRADFVLIS